MAIGSFGRGKDEDSKPMSAPASTGGGSGNLSAFIDQGSNFEGKLSFKDTVRIDGGFKGEISSENTLIVGESGEIEALISSKQVIVSGNVVGNITASEQVVLHKSAHVDGDISTPSIVVEKGAVFNGGLSMNGKGSNLKAVPTAGAPSGNNSPNSNPNNNPSSNPNQSNDKHIKKQ
jgi:cytoskeletal protein CcmA (bactofilin family)